MKTQNLVTLFNKSKANIIKYSPEILIATGIVSGAAGLGLCIKKSINIKDKLEDNYIELIEVDREDKKELVKAYGRAAGVIAREYAPVLLLEGISVASFIGSNRILNEKNKKLTEQNLSLIAAISLIEKDFSRYRSNVRAKYGDEADEELYFGVETEKITVTEVDENGKKRKVKKEVKYSTNYSPYAIFLDASNLYRSDCQGWNVSQIMAIEKSINFLAQEKGKVFLSDIYNMFDIPDDKLTVEQRRAARVCGYVWNYDDVCDKQIHFMVSDSWNKEAVAAAESGELREDIPWLVDFSNISYIAEDYAKGAGTFYNYEAFDKEEA